MISYEELLQQNVMLRVDLDEANETLRAIRTGEVDALVVSTDQGDQVFALKTADQPYRVLIEEMKDGAVTLADDGTILYCNRYFAEMLDCSPSEILSHSIYDYFIAADAAALHNFLQSNRNQQSTYFEFNLRTPGGTVIPIHLAANTLQFDQIQVTCLVIADLRAQKQREEEINLLQTLGLEMSQSRDLDGALQRVLEHICLKTGWEAGEVWMRDEENYCRKVGWHQPGLPDVTDAISQRSRIPIGDGLLGQMWLSKTPTWFSNVTEEVAFQYQVTGLRSGVGFPVEANSEVIAVILFFTTQPRPSDEHFSQLISSIATHLGTYIVRKQAEDQVQYQAKFLETVRDPIISTSPDTLIVTWNHAAEVVYGWSAAEVIGKRYLDILPHEYPFDTPENAASIVLEQGYWAGELLQTARDGSHVHVLSSVSLMYDDKGQPVRAIITHHDITERKKSEQALLESERFARSTVDALSAQIAILDESGTIIAVNQAWRNYAQNNGGDPDYVFVGQNYLTICDNATTDIEYARTVAKGIRDLLRKGRGSRNQFMYEYACHTPTEQRWFNVHILPFVGDGPLRLVVAHENITERKLAENAFLETHEQLVVLNHVMSKTTTTLDSRVILDLACKELGAVFGVSWVVAALASDDDTSISIVAEYSQDGQQSTLNQILTHQVSYLRAFIERDKNPFVVTDVQSDPLADFFHDFLVEQGIVSFLIIPLLFQDKLIGAIGVSTTKARLFTESEMSLAGSVAQVISQALENSLLHQSIADQNLLLEQTVDRRTDQLKRLNDRMSTILDNTSDAIILTLPDGTIQNTNLAFEHLFQYDRDEMYGQSIARLATVDFRERLLDTLSRPVRPHSAPHLQISALRKDGSVFFVDCGFAYVKSADASVVWTMRDITHLKAVERIKDQFVSMVSHELRTPLTSMVLSSSSLQRHYARMNDEKRLEIIDRLNNQGAVMVELIEGILDLSRIDDASIVPGNAIIDMRQMIEKVVIQLQDSINTKNHTLKINAGTTACWVMGSDLDFTRIWRNLVSNAIKYTPDGGTITVNLGSLSVISVDNIRVSENIALDSLKLPLDMVLGEYVVGQVMDTGHGIRPQDLEQLFSRFFRGNASQSNIPGTGLGLALVRELLKLYGGNISVVTELNKGSIFSFWIPRAKEHTQ